MHFHISRNGQVYGPYTLEDLHRYLASGNVLPTDLARRDDMTEWLPVAQILATYGGQATAPGAPVYATPVYNPATGALAVSAYPEPPNMPWFLVALINVVTGGLFMQIWNIVIAAWLRRVQPNATSMYYYIAVLFLGLISGGMQVAHFVHRHSWSVGSDYRHGDWSGFLQALLLGAVIWVIKLMARFSQKASLEEHFNGPEPTGLQLNGVMVFFFGGLYFQHELSRIVEMKRMARMATGVPQY